MGRGDCAGPPERTPRTTAAFGMAATAGSQPVLHLPGEQAARGERLHADRRLFERFADDRDAVDRDAIVERFLPLARQLAARYMRPGEPFDDVFKVACLGLVNAVDRFEVDRGVAFSSYAVPTIVGEIKRHFRDHTWAVRVPRDGQEFAARVECVTVELASGYGRQPSVDEVAREVDSEPDAVLDAMEAWASYRTVSLDAPRVADDNVRCSVPTSERSTMARAEERVMLRDLTRSLTVRECQVVRLRFDEDLTQAAIGERIGVSQMQVSRLLRQALARLREEADAGSFV
jgi:RNA polymerase sigma-B factor